jgi:hydrogenase nickel incorporation protein HypA/HybF
MHELAITDAIVAGVCERIGDVRVRRVTVEIGRLTAVVPDSVRFCFDVCARGTVLEGADLDIIVIPGRARCRRCLAEVEVQALSPLCGCGASELEVVSGLELLVRSVEVD